MNSDGRITILLVEDEFAIAMSETAILQKNDYRVIVVSTGEEAVEAVGKNPEIDLILMDIDLGKGMDGTQAAKLIIEKQDLPVIFLSAHIDQEVVEKTGNISSYGYIVKTTGETVLLTSIKMAFRLFEAKRRERQKEEKIKTLLEEKELLLREVHHRIKNNMRTMMALLTLHAGTLEDPNAVAALGDARSRLHSMSVLYDKLYRTENLRAMSIKDYLPTLADQIINVFPNKAAVKIKTRIDDFMLGVKAFLPLGIIVNEILTNIMKYAFVGRDDGLITLSGSIKDKQATIVIEDNGVGIPESVDFETSTGFGLQLVGMLTKQIGGTIRIERVKGTRIILEFEVYKR